MCNYRSAARTDRNQDAGYLLNAAAGPLLSLRYRDYMETQVVAGLT